ncbi:MAG: glycosyltransferase family 4 protein, partial [Patescibacteria group bacterium]
MLKKSKKLENLRVAIVCDWLTSRGGAEKVTEVLAEIFPQADIYASVVEKKLFPWLDKHRVFVSWLDHIPWFRKKHQLFPHLRPLIFENFDLSDYDLVISSASAESKSVLTKPGTLHVCYCHTPIRYYWSDYYNYFTKRLEFGWLNPLVKLVMPYFTNYLRMYDRLSAERVDFFVANSVN